MANVGTIEAIIVDSSHNNSSSSNSSFENLLSVASFLALFLLLTESFQATVASSLIRVFGRERLLPVETASELIQSLCATFVVNAAASAAASVVVDRTSPPPPHVPSLLPEVPSSPRPPPPSSPSEGPSNPVEKEKKSSSGRSSCRLTSSSPSSLFFGAASSRKALVFLAARMMMMNPWNASASSSAPSPRAAAWLSEGGGSGGNNSPRGGGRPHHPKDNWIQRCTGTLASIGGGRRHPDEPPEGRKFVVPTFRVVQANKKWRLGNESPAALSNKKKQVIGRRRNRKKVRWSNRGNGGGIVAVEHCFERPPEEKPAKQLHYRLIKQTLRCRKMGGTEADVDEIYDRGDKVAAEIAVRFSV